MITKVSSLQWIRNFIDFNSNIELKKRNIIYAPNGSGKTNLSRLLNSLKLAEPINKYISQEALIEDHPKFSIELTTDIIDHDNYQDKSGLLSKVFVFNSDFVEETIKSQNFSHQNVSGKVEIPIGIESNEIETLEKKIINKEQSNKEAYNNLKQRFNKFLNTKKEIPDYSKEDRNIWSELILEKLITKDLKINFPEKSTAYASCEENLKKLKNINESSLLVNNNPYQINSESINYKDIISDLKEPKHFEIADKKTQQILAEITRSWLETEDIKTGIDASKEAGKCLLCQRDLDNSVNQLFKGYELYFKNAESKFKSKLDTIKSQLKKHINEISKINNDLELVTNSNAAVLKIDKLWKKINTTTLTTQLEELVSSIERKTSNPMQNTLIGVSNVSEATISTELKALNSNLKHNNLLVDEINRKLKTSGQRKSELRTEVGKKWLYEFYISEKSTIDPIETTANDIIELLKKLENVKEKLPTSDVLSNLIKIGNHFLHKYLSLVKYSFGESEERIVINLNDRDISSETNQKISEGEKTMLALCYFLAASIRDLKSIKNFKESVFIIDDPVSSTSYNYLFGIGFLLRSFDEEIANIIWPIENFQNGNNIQKIIFTHNTPLFNSLRTQIFKDDYHKKQNQRIPKNTIYLLMDHKSFKEVPEKQLKSEFETSLLAIKTAFKATDDNHIIGNDLRRILETIKHFYGMHGSFDANWLKKVFKDFDIVNHKVFFGIINYYSHGNPEAHEDPLHPTNFRVFLDQFNQLISNSNFEELWNSLDN